MNLTKRDVHHFILAKKLTFTMTHWKMELSILSRSKRVKEKIVTLDTMCQIHQLGVSNVTNVPLGKTIWEIQLEPETSLVGKTHSLETVLKMPKNVEIAKFVENLKMLKLQKNQNFENLLKIYKC